MKSSVQKFKDILKSFRGNQLISVKAAISLIDQIEAEEIAMKLRMVRFRAGQICPECGCHDSRVKDSRDKSLIPLYRRRECMNCGTRWNTAEVIQPDKGEI